MKKLFKWLFNSNTGYFLNPQTYWYNGNIETGYVLCRGYIIFGIPGYDRIGLYLIKKEANVALKKIKNHGQ